MCDLPTGWNCLVSWCGILWWCSLSVCLVCLFVLFFPIHVVIMCHANYGNITVLIFGNLLMCWCTPFVLISMQIHFSLLIIMVLSFPTFTCRGLQDSFKHKTIFSYLHKRKDDSIFYRKLTVLLLMKNFGLPNGAVIHGSVVLLQTAEGLLFLLSLIIKFLLIPLTKTLLVDLLFWTLLLMVPI